MNIKQRGNIFIGFIAAILIISMIYFLFVPQVKKRVNNQQEIPSKLANDLGEHTNTPPPPLPEKKYEGAFSWTNRVDITENPFNTESSDLGSSFKFAERNKSTNINADLKEPELKVTEKHNIFDETPTGYAFPKNSGYLDGYPYNHDTGTLLLTFDNSNNQTDLLIYLFRISDVFDKTTKKPQFSRAIYVKSNDKLVLNDLISGVYSLRWLELSSGKAQQYQDFELHKDNKYQYNRYFKFSQNGHKDLQKLPLSAFYAN